MISVRSVTFNAWPVLHQSAYAEANITSDSPCGNGPASHWSKATHRGVKQTWGLWLDYCCRYGIPIERHPAETISALSLEGFIRELLDRVSLSTAASYVRDVGEAVRVMQPDAVPTLLLVRSAAADLKRVAQPAPDNLTTQVGASQVYEAALARMDRSREQSLICRRTGQEFLDGLMMAFDVLTLVRLRTLALTDREAHLSPIGSTYEVAYGAHEIKTKKSFDAILPVQLTPYLEHGVMVAAWLGEGSGDVEERPMWVTRTGTRMSDRQIHARLCAATQKEVGVRLNPQRLRRLGPTSLSQFAPWHIELAQQALQHHKPALTVESYVKCSGGAAAVELHRLLTTKFGRGGISGSAEARSANEDRGGSDGTGQAGR